MLMAVFVLSPHGDPTSHFMDTFNSLKANVDRLWPCSISSVPSLPPSVVLRQPHRQAGSPVISSTSLTSHPAAQHSSPHPHGGDLQHWMREQGPLFLLQERPGLSQPFFSGFPTNVFAHPQQTHNSPGAGAGPGIEILHNPNRHTESPSLPTHNKQSSVNKTNRHTHKKFLR